MKALVISREYPPAISGVSTYINEILKRTKFDFKIICTYEIGRKSTKNIIEIKYPKSIKKIRYITAFYYSFKVLTNSLKENFDVIIGNALVGSAASILVKILKRKPLVSIIHDIDYIEKNVKEFSFWNKAFRKFTQRIIFLSSNKIIVPSKKVKNDIINYHNIPSNKIFIVPNGIITKKSFRKIKKHNSVVLFVGALLRKHDLENLIKSFNIVNNNFKNVELWIIGPVIFKEYFRELKSLVRDLNLENKVKFLGAIKDIISYYKACDIFAISSYHSVGFGIPCIEASSLGKPIVATKIYGQTGVVVNNKTGLIVPPKNPKAMAKAIIKLLKNRKLRYKFGKQGKIFSRRFNWDTSAKKFENIVLGLLR